MITMDTGLPNPSGAPFPAAVALAIMSFLMATLIIPVLYFHIRHKNIGAIFLTSWIVYLNIQSFVNSIIWNNDDLPSYFNGRILCHIESKLIVASQVGVPSAMFCMLRALVVVMRNAKNPQLMQTTRQKIFNLIVDLTCCILPPALQMIFSWVVSPAPYEVIGIAGCVPSPGTMWATIWLLLLPPLLWSVINGCLCIAIVVLLISYRERLSSVMRNGNTTKARFFRIFALCGVYGFGLIPLSTWVFVRNALLSKSPFDWNEIHHGSDSGVILFTPSGGKIFYDRYIWLTMAFLTFLFFGLGREARDLYRKSCCAVGLGRIFPSLETSPQNSMNDHVDHPCTFTSNWTCKHCRFNFSAFVEAVIPRLNNARRSVSKWSLSSIVRSLRSGSSTRSHDPVGLDDLSPTDRHGRIPIAVESQESDEHWLFTTERMEELASIISPPDDEDWPLRRETFVPDDWPLRRESSVPTDWPLAPRAPSPVYHRR